MLERNKLREIIKKIEDFWMFDRKTAVQLVYDKTNNFFKFEEHNK
jgi:hypothetical protein